MPSSGWRFCLLTFGCKVNQYESQALREAWKAQGGQETEDLAYADIVCINSCAITARGERDARNAVFRARRESPGARIILTGCATRLFAGFVPRRGQEWHLPDLLVPQEDKSSLLNGPWPECQAECQAGTALNGHVTAFPDQPTDHDLAKGGFAATRSKENQQIKKRPEIASLSDARRQDKAFPAFAINGYYRARAILKVQDGCDHYCSFCIVPQTRGKPVSRQPGDILAEARRLILAGHSELVISGINLSMYGKDWQGKMDGKVDPARSCQVKSAQGNIGNEDHGNDGRGLACTAQPVTAGQNLATACAASGPQIKDFWDLLAWLDKKLAAEFPGQARLRISSLEPGQLDQRGLEILTSSRIVCPQLHISLQHGSDKVLKRMNRGHYSAQMLVGAVKVLSRHWPLFGLGADLLVGFPGETEDDLEELLALVRELPFSYAHVFPYSARPGTAAARMKDQLPAREKAARAAAVRQVIEAKKTAFLERQLDLPEVSLAINPATLRSALETGGKKQLEAVNEYYGSCRFDTKSLRQDLFSGLPGDHTDEQKRKQLNGLVRARPVKLTDSALEVELLFS